MPDEGQQVSLKDANAHYLKEETARRSQQQLTAKQIRDALELFAGKEKNEEPLDDRPPSRKSIRK